MHQLATRLMLKSTGTSKNKLNQLVHWTFSEAQTFVQVGQIQVLILMSLILLFDDNS